MFLSLRGFVLLSLSLAASPLLAQNGFLVENGQPRAEIVISDKPERSVRLAAQELRAGVEKISGARLAIVTAPSGKVPLKMFVGRSAYTDKLGVTAEGLKDGAYRIVSGPDWMVLLGQDTDFVPVEPWARGNNDIARVQAEWEKITGEKWGAPNMGLYKNRLKLPGDTGKPDGVDTARKEVFEIWAFDERGSFNAVCGWLQRLGVRWYMPGDIGEVLPQMKSIPLEKIDETVRPDFTLRQFNFRFGVLGYDASMWAMRLGLRPSATMMIAHGFETMTGRDAIFNAHPEWFALYGGKRDYVSGESKNQLCYSNEELFQHTVRSVRAQLDLYKFETVSVMPPDGYSAICQCPKCRGQDSPERNERGLLSDHVWGFVNRVAREVHKTHPNGKVLNCAYGAYSLPPLKIDKLESNVVVCIVGGRRPINKGNGKGEGETAPEALRAAWQKKTDNPLFVFENYPFTDRGWYLPCFAPHVLGASVNATKGISQGEDVWLSVGNDFVKTGLGFNHFMVYFTARMYWGGKNADVDAMFREYCQLFYGPAAQEMHAFFTYCEEHWDEMEKEKEKADLALALFEKAKAKSVADSVHGRRLAFIDDFLKGLRMKTHQLAQKRGPVPVLRLVGGAEGIVIDGKLDDAYWQRCPGAATGKLRELQTGRAPLYGTFVKAGWQGSSLCFAIRCDERPGDKLNDTATRNGDPAIWQGDVMEIEIETETHSYYQIAISPSGDVVDLDRGAPQSNRFGWDSKAEVATKVEDGHWTVEIRLPVTDDENDPLNQIIGRRPTQSLPWHINVCRQRIREDGAEYSALSPTGTEGFHEPLKFAHFYDGRSHKFEADATVTDFVIGLRAAEELIGRERKFAEALSAFLALSGGKVSDLQKSIALDRAVDAACRLKDFAQADALVARIPIESVKKTAQMRILLEQFKAPVVIAQFAGEDIKRWPFWQRGAGYALRGRAHQITKGKEAEDDLVRALEFTSDERLRQGIWLDLGNHRETVAKNDAAALEAYRMVFANAPQIGGADEFGAVQAASRIFSRMGKHDEALATLRFANPEKQTGVWRGNLMLTLGDIQAAAGRQAEARAAYQSVADDAQLSDRFRSLARQKLAP